MASWSVTSLWLVALLGTASMILMVRSSPRGGRHRGRLASLLLLLLAMGAFVNDNFGYLPQLGDIVGPRPWPVVSAQVVLGGVRTRTSAFPQGAVLSLPVRGVHSHVTTDPALVYLPPEYFREPDRHFPVLYLLHGSPGVPLDWFRGGEAAHAGLVSARRGKPTILVAPRMSRGWLDDSECVDRPGFAAESYLTQDVVPTVDVALRTRRDRQARGLAGNSSGGYCALALGLRHPDLFTHVAALSPTTVPTFAYGSLADLFGKPIDLPAVVEEHTPAWLLLHQPASRSVSLRLDVGRQDRLLSRVRQFVAVDRSLNGNPQLIVRSGGHNFRTWRPALQDAVLWFADSVGRSFPTGSGL